ncbi:hypothetical protein MMC13_000699 [Lambiella insularis]|nr:hypothetical protein [Lambiella insularis]
MSKVKGLGEVAIVTVLGVATGVHIFGPALKDQGQKKQEETKEEQTPPVVLENVLSADLEPKEALSEHQLSRNSALTDSPTTKLEGSSWKLQDWKTFWMEGDRALRKRSLGNSLKDESSQIIPSRTNTNTTAMSESPVPPS